ncbi:hypothetical protein SLS62_008451 [Diatrype stigma]|uniref:Cytidyltransferase-like domain-containing protein n=1 Tax=Diatrype stigma TaxID=117547 RepID=A0AAN9UL97_9PEZI
MVSLEAYIRSALPPGDKRTRVFHDAPGRTPPTLSRDHANRILLFNGCFNPPHRGHLALLEDAFHHSGEDLHAIAAVVLVASEEYLRWKFHRPRAEGRDVHLSDAQRIQLWEGELGATNNNWCLAYPEDQWWEVSDRLKRDLARDGFELEFVRVAGGDKVGLRSQAHGQWNCRTLITSDICRRVDFFDGGGKGHGDDGGNDSPATLKNHRPWREVKVADEILRERARQHVLHSPGLDGSGVVMAVAGDAGGTGAAAAATAAKSSLVEDNEEDREAALARRIDEEYLRSLSVRNKKRLWTCDCTSNSRGYTLRFIASDDHLSPDISSTNLRNIIANTELSELEDKLQGIALSPALLTRFVFARYGI